LRLSLSIALASLKLQALSRQVIRHPTSTSE
jgi:hypothetical protein